MTTLAHQHQGRVAFRRLSPDAVVVYGLFAVTLVLLACSAVTGWRVAHGSAPQLIQIEEARSPIAQPG